MMKSRKLKKRAKGEKNIYVFPWQEYHSLELKVYFFAFRVLIFTNMFTMERINKVIYNIFLKGKIQKLSSLKKTILVLPYKYNFVCFGQTQKIRFLRVNTFG